MLNNKEFRRVLEAPPTSSFSHSFLSMGSGLQGVSEMVRLVFIRVPSTSSLLQACHLHIGAGGEVLGMQRWMESPDFDASNQLSALGPGASRQCFLPHLYPEKLPPLTIKQNLENPRTAFCCSPVSS